MKLTNQEKTRFTGIFNDFQGKTEATEKQSVISALTKDELEKFTFYLYNEAYKYIEDLKSGGYSPADRLQVTKDQLKEISPYLVTAKVRNIYNELGDNPSEDEITEQIKAEFKIQEGEISEEKLTEMANVLKGMKDSGKTLQL